MKVRDLIEFLSEMDDDADVIIVTQPAWPFENRLDGIIQRDQMEQSSGGGHFDGGRNGSDNDVLLACGRQLRYGPRSIWDEVIS